MSKHDVPQGSGFRVRYGFSKNGKDLKFVAPSGPDRDVWLSRLQLAAGSYVWCDDRVPPAVALKHPALLAFARSFDKLEESVQSLQKERTRRNSAYPTNVVGARPSEQGRSLTTWLAVLPCSQVLLLPWWHRHGLRTSSSRSWRHRWLRLSARTVTCSSASRDLKRCVHVRVCVCVCVPPLQPQSLALSSHLHVCLCLCLCVCARFQAS